MNVIHAHRDIACNAPHAQMQSRWVVWGCAILADRTGLNFCKWESVLTIELHVHVHKFIPATATLSFFLDKIQYPYRTFQFYH